MGGVLDGGFGIGIKTSPCRAAIEKAQAELRQEYDVREESRRELEFLEKGGNPLDFKFGNMASLSLQSTSIPDRHLEQFQTSDAKDSFAFAASPLGDSVESSGRLGPSVSGRKITDNPLLFDGENGMLEGGKNLIHPVRKNYITSSEQSSQMDGNRNTKESEDLAIFRPYARRNRTRTNRDGARLGTADGVQNRGGQGPSLASHASIRDTKVSSSETNSQKEEPNVAGMNGDMVSRTATPESCLDGQIDGEQALVLTSSLKQSGFPADKLDMKTRGSKDKNWHKKPFRNCKTPDTGTYLISSTEGTVSDGTDELPSLTKEREINSDGLLNVSSNFKGNSETTGDEVQKNCEAFDRKGPDSSIHPSLHVDVKKDSACNNASKISSNKNNEVQLSESEMNQKLAGGERLEQGDINRIIESIVIASNESYSAQQNQAGNVAMPEGGEETDSRSDLMIKVNDTSGADEDEREGQVETENGREERNFDHNSNLDRENFCNTRSPDDLSSSEVPSMSLSVVKHAAPSECQASGNDLSMGNKAYEDSILEEAQIIQAKHERIAELSSRTSPLEIQKRCHWNFVLEEMAWLANDFAQERLWKMTAAAQLCHGIASLLRNKCEEQSQRRKLKIVGHNLAKAVMQFWHSAEVLLNGDNPNLGLEAGGSKPVGSQKKNVSEFSNSKVEDPNMDSSKKPVPQTTGGSTNLPIQSSYAVQFLRDSNPHIYLSQAQAPETPDIVSDVDMAEVSWDDHLTEESLFYTIPSTAMETYRRSIEAFVRECERTGSNVQEEVGTSTFSAVADQGSQQNAYDDGEAETSAYYLVGTLEGSRSSKFSHKRKNLRLYEHGADLPYGHYTTLTQPSTLLERKPGNLTVGPIPAKRMRTANVSRQRVPSPFGNGAHGTFHAQAKTEVSSGDTDSFHDDQNSLHGGSWVPKGLEVESAGDFEKHVSYDYAETFTKLKKKKKKKKAKHLDSTFEPRWQLGSAALTEQREQSKKRSEHFESNGTSGSYVQQSAKKPKIMKQLLDNTYDNIMSVSGSIPYPMTSQMSNMSNQNKLMRYIDGDDRSRKAKVLKVSSLHVGPGSPWSLFEDQALVVLVHDMGRNWELVSDAINSTLQFKCIFRNPKACKERHKFLMDKSSGDGADSAEDSGSSQSYPSTLPGIPKGSARQLFQRLQDPVEEDALKEHFDKIIQIAQRQHQRIQVKNESQDLEQVTDHESHVAALSQVCPNNLNGVFLSPLDLIEATASSSDVLPLSYQVSHASDLAIQSHGGSVASVHAAASGVNSPVPGPSGFVPGNNMLPAGPLNAPTRDGRHNIPKTSSSPADEHRMQPYNQVLSNRPIPLSTLSISGAVPGSNRGGHALPGGTGLGRNRTNMPMARPGFPGMASSPMVNSSSVLTSPMVGAQSPVNIHGGSGPVQGRPGESMHMAKGGNNTGQQREMPAQEHPMHVTQGTAQGTPSFNGMGSSFSNHIALPVQTYEAHSQQQHCQASKQQSHASSNLSHHPQLQGINNGSSLRQQQIYLRIAKERQQQQHYLQQHQQQHHFAASNNLMPHVHSPSQLPVSLPLQSSPQIQSQSPSQSASLRPSTLSSPMTSAALLQQQQKNQLPPQSHGIPRNQKTTVRGLSNHMCPKQKQRQAQQQQQFQQSVRAHPQQRPQAQPHQQQAKLSKGIGRGNILVHQKFPTDPSHLNGLSTTPGSLGVEKEMTQQGQGIYSGPGINQLQPSKAPIPQTPHHSHLLSGPADPHSTNKRHLQQQVLSHSENNVQEQCSAIPPGHDRSSALHPAVPSTLVNLHSGPLLSQPQQNQVSQTQKIAPQNHQHMNDDQLQMKSQPDKDQAADQKLVNAMSPQAGICTVAPPAVSAVESAVRMTTTASPDPQHKASGAGCTTTSTQVGTIGNETLLSSASSEQLSSVGQGVGQRHLAENLTRHSQIGSGAHVAEQSSEPLLSSSQQHYLPHSQEQCEEALPQKPPPPPPPPLPQPQPQPQPPQTQHL